MSPLHLLLGLVIALAWGLNFVVMKIGLEQLSPFWFGTLRFAIVLLLLLPWLKVTRGAMTQLFLVGLCIGGLHFGFVFYGMNITTQVSAIVVVVQMNIPITLILAHVFLNEKISGWRMTGIAVAFGGVIVITFDPAIAGEGPAIGIMLIAVTLYSIGTTMMRRMQTVGILRVQAWTALYSVPLLLALSLQVETGQIGELVHLDALHWGMVIYTAVISSIVGYGGINYLLKHYTVAQVAPILLLVPVFATAAAVIFLGEVLSMRFIAGAGITLGGLGLIHYRDWLKKRKLPKEMLP